MKRYFFLGDGGRYYHGESDGRDMVTLVTSFSFSRFLEKNGRAPFDLLIIDGMAGSNEVGSFLSALEREPFAPPAVLISPPAYPLDPALAEHPLVAGIYEGPPLLDDLLDACESFSDNAGGTVAGGGDALSFHGIMGISDRVRNLCGQIAKYALHKDYPVLILGENGTGKDLVARALHRIGHGDKPFVPYQASSGGENLMASDLFGVRKGAYTGSEDREGLLARAEGGVFFLDEIGLLSLKNQAAFLRVLEEKKMRPLGASREQDVNFRLLSATNEDLNRALGEGTFRTDLYHRINTLIITVPPLRERKEDIPTLAESFTSPSDRERPFTGNALEKLMSYHWPGNIRELRNVVHRALVECGGGKMIETRHIIFQ